MFDSYDDLDFMEEEEVVQESLLDGMNDNQVKAITFNKGTALVVAGAGSGKTTVMTKRVAALIENGVYPENILLLTFTRMAANNMVERAKRYTPFAEQVNSGTFHSIAHRLIKENADLFKMETVPSIMDPNDTAQTFKRIVKARGKKDEGFPKAEIIAKAHSFASNTLRSLDDVIYDKYEKFSHTIDYMADCIGDYKAFKRERNLFDYDDLLVVWDKMLDNPSIATQMQEKFKYIMIDEHQDSNALQCSIIEKLGGENPNIMVVGDPAQAIYGFRGAAPRTMFAFQELWPQTQTIYLNVNYRSTEEVLNIGNVIDENMTERFDRYLEPRGDAHGDLPSIVGLASPAIEANYIAKMVLKNKESGTPLHEQAVLVRSLFAGRAIEIEFKKQGIPHKVSGGIKISEARHIKDFLSVIRCAVNTLDEPAWLRALGIGKGVGPAMGEKVFKIISEAPSELKDLTEAILKKTKNNPDVSKVMESWRILISKEDKPIIALKKVLLILTDIFARNYQEDWDKSRKRDIEAVIAMSGQFESLDEYLTAMTLDHSVEKTSDDIRDGNAELPVTISTVHSAKGLEWDVVYIPNFNQGHFPSAFARDHESMEEEKRVLYVATTRPRKKLIFTIPAYDFQGNKYDQSTFYGMIEELCELSKYGEDGRHTGFGLRKNKSDFIDLSNI